LCTIESKNVKSLLEKKKAPHATSFGQGPKECTIDDIDENDPESSEGRMIWT